MPAPIDYFSSESLRRDLKGKTVRGGITVAAAQIATVLINLATLPIYTRLLEKSDFGLVAMVTFFTGFAAMFVNAGLSMATVQRDEITRQQVSNLFWIASGLGVVIALAVAAMAPAISWFYVEPRLTSITLALTVSFVLTGLVIQHQALLRRGMQFKEVALVGVASQVGAHAVGVAWAWRHAADERDYWALVLIPITAALIRLSLTWAVCPWRPGLPRRGAGTRRMIEFGANLTGFNFVNYFVRNADYLVIGWWWGAASLGVYERAYKLFLSPLQLINAPLAGVMVPALSRLNEEPSRYREYYLGVVGKLALVLSPAAVYLCSAADLVIPFVFGPGWEESVPILRALSIVGAVQVIGATLGWLYVSQSRTNDMLKWVLMASPLLLLSYVVGVRWGPLGVAVAYACVSVLVTFPLNILYACRFGPVSSRPVFILLVEPFVLGAVAAAGAYVGRFLAADYPPPTAFVLSAVSALLGMIAAALVLPSTRKTVSSSLTTIRESLRG